MEVAGLNELPGSGSFSPGEESEYALHTFGAVFVEVGVDAGLGLVRLRRAVGRYSVGRIVRVNGKREILALGTDTDG
jgi:xanthine dehydrogenase YagR molybdenum-binding subunit